jgi:hypothetical protein
MAAPANSSPYSGLPQVILHTVAGYLGFADAATKYTVLNREHLKLSKQGFWAIQEVSIRVRHLDKLRPLVPRLVTLKAKGIDDCPEFRLPELATVTRLICDEYCRPPALAIHKLLEAVTQIRDLRLSVRSFSNTLHFQPRAGGECLTPLARINLNQLTQLDLSGSNIDPQGVLAFVQCSQQFESVNLNSQELSDAVLMELGRSPNLKRLSLRWTKGEFNHRLIAENCHALIDFTPGGVIGLASHRADMDLFHYMNGGAAPDEAGIKAREATLAAAVASDGDTLLAIIAANPKLTRLDLSRCPPAMITDQLLGRIAKLLPELKDLRIPSSSKITDVGFRALVEGCPHLEILILEDIADVSLDAIKLLGNHCPNLSQLLIRNKPLDNGFIESLATKRNLKILELPSCIGFDASLIQALVYLEELNLDACKVNDPAIIAIVDHCPLLSSLRINCWESGLTPAILTHIGERINERRVRLNYLSCRESGIDHETIDRFSAAFPQVTVR